MADGEARVGLDFEDELYECDWGLAECRLLGDPFLRLAPQLESGMAMGWAETGLARLGVSVPFVMDMSVKGLPVDDDCGRRLSPEFWIPLALVTIFFFQLSVETPLDDEITKHGTERQKGI